jgi:hypothetical protein
MTRVIVDAVTLERLRNAREPVELSDSTGQLLGHFLPVFKRPLSARMEPAISEEELDRRQAAGGGRRLADILSDLEKRA